MLKNLQKEIVDLAHRGHRGMTRTKQLLREKVWFPSMDRISEENVKNCFPCQAVTPQNTHEPIQVTLTNRSMNQVSCDFADVGNGEYIMIIIDDFTRYPEVIPLKTLTATKVIHEMETIFSRFGNPNILKTDNGPPFNSHEIASYMKDNRIKHHRITPLWPEAKGELERFVRTIKKAINAAKVEGKEWKKEINIFLKHYRATPHAKSHQQKECWEETCLPEWNHETATRIEQEIIDNDQRTKGKMKSYADKRRHTKECDIKVGDKVLVVKTAGFRKKSYDPVPYTVTVINGSQITAEHEGHKITRNTSFYKRIPSDCVPPTLSDDDTDIDYEELVLNPAPAPQLNQGAVQVDPHAVDTPVPVP